MSQAESPALPPHSHLTPKEIAVFLHVNQRTVYRLCEDGGCRFCVGGMSSVFQGISFCGGTSSAGNVLSGEMVANWTHVDKR